jgi:hypothetical protein
MRSVRQTKQQRVSPCRQKARPEVCRAVWVQVEPSVTMSHQSPPRYTRTSPGRSCPGCERPRAARLAHEPVAWRTTLCPRTSSTWAGDIPDTTRQWGQAAVMLLSHDGPRVSCKHVSKACVISDHESLDEHIPTACPIPIAASAPPAAAATGGHVDRTGAALSTRVARRHQHATTAHVHSGLQGMWMVGLR